MEGGDALRAGRDAAGAPDRSDYGRRLLGALVAGALAGAAVAVAVGFGTAAAAPRAAAAFRAFLAAGGWVWIPLWGAALAALGAIGWTGERRQRMATAALAGVLAALPLVVRPAVRESPAARLPSTPRAKARAILAWSYRSPQTVARIIELSRDPDSRVREQAILALGVNLIVTDIEHATPIRPSRFGQDPLRDRLRVRLLQALRGDSVESVRAEAARALWKAPVAFGRQPAAAETLAAVLDRALRAGAVERLAWLALDAAAGVPDRALKAAAARFAAATADSDLARAARQAARR